MCSNLDGMAFAFLLYGLLTNTLHCTASRFTFLHFLKGKITLRIQMILSLAFLYSCGLLKCGFCKKLHLYECNSDQLPIVFILLSLLGGFAVALLLHTPKSDDKNVQRNVQLIRGSFGREILLIKSIL